MNAKRIMILGVLVVACDVTVTRTEEIVKPQQSIDSEIKGRNNRGKDGLDKKTQDILARFANIFLSFLGILQNPDNPTEHVVNMVTGAVQMVAEAVKAGELSIDASDDEIRAYASQVTHSVEPVLKRIIL